LLHETNANEPDLIISVSVVVGTQLSDDDYNNVDQKQSVDLTQQTTSQLSLMKTTLTFIHSLTQLIKCDRQI